MWVNAKLETGKAKLKIKKIVFFSGSYVYVQLFHFNGKEKNLFIATKAKLLNLHIGAWEKCLIYKTVSNRT